MESNIDVDTITTWYPEIEPNHRQLLGKAFSGQRLVPYIGTITTEAYLHRTANIFASLLAGIVVKEASRQAFVEYGRSMTSPDVLKMIGKAFETIVAAE
jgi:hypothetical protein